MVFHFIDGTESHLKFMDLITHSPLDGVEYSSAGHHISSKCSYRSESVTEVVDPGHPVISFSMVVESGPYPPAMLLCAGVETAVE